MKSPIILAEAARKEIQKTFASKQLPPQYALRVGLKGAGCGASYLLGFDKPSPTDDHFDLDGIPLLIDRRHLMYLMGVELNYEEGDEGRGFFFNNEPV